jgi:uncharacterized membrane protein YcaP (DUF421 family)
MIQEVWNFFLNAIGYDSTWLIKLSNMLVRAVIIYLFGVSLARFNKKLLGLRTPFNFILFVMIGSISANAIAVRAFFLPTLCTLLFLTMLNGLITTLSFYFPVVERLVKGGETVVVKDGRVRWEAMAQDLITERELMNELRAKLHTNDIKEVKLATLTSDGSISFVRK